MILEIIESYFIEEFRDLGVITLQVIKPKGKNGGRPTEAYLLNENHFTFLVMMMKNTKEVVKLKLRVAKEFIRMKNTLANIASQKNDIDWQNVRSDGKSVYHDKSTVVTVS